ncbi:MAG: choice-of-anchor J domain-containing protein, partial [Candidatus Thermoplasmatota archaeon]
MKEKNVVGSLVLRKGIVAAIVVLLLGAGLMMLPLLTKARTDPCVITGYVYDENGNPLEGATVRVRDEITGAWGENITDASGMYSITLGGGPSSPPWMEWFDGDPLLATATYDGREGKAFRYIEASEIDQQGYMWLNITLGTPVTTKTVGKPEFIKYDYDNGETNYGYLVSPVINVTADVATLSFWTWWQIEGAEPAAYDLMNVSISTDGGYNWNLLTKPGGNPSATLNPAENPADGSEYNYYGSSGFNVTPSWVYETFDISEYVPNEIVIIFEFNTIDPIFNYWEGWYIDDIKITEFGGNVPFSDDVENGIGNWTYNGYWHISEHRSKSSSHAWYYGIEKSYVSSDTLFTLEAEGDYEAIYYRINGGNWIEYDEPFNLTEECEHYIEFYAENGSNSEPLNSQIHYVDNSAPVSNYSFGEPNSTLNYGGHNYTAIKICTPMIIYAYDLPEGCAAGVEWLNYSVWWNPNEPNNYTKIKEVKVHDNDINDTDKRVGFINVELHFNEECFHEIKWQMVDYLGHISQQHSIDIAVDATAPTINKTIGEPKYVDEKGWLWVNCSTPFWFNITDSGCGGGVGVWKFGMNIYWNETRVPEGQQQLLTLVEQIVVVDNLAEITMELYNESYGTFIVNTTTTELEELLTEPLNSIWYNNSNEYKIIEWNDNGNGTLDYCDYIRFNNSQLKWHVENIKIVVKDLNPKYGEISYLFRFCDLPEEYRECFHEPEIWAIDYVGNNISFKEKDMVDCTPPAINKTVEKVIKAEQTQMNNSSSTYPADYQSFKAPWSYIDAISVYLIGTFDSAYPIYIEIYNDSNGEPGTELDESEHIFLSGNKSDWIQFNLSKRLYVEEGATYWIKLVYNNTQQPIKWMAQSNYPSAGPYPDGFAIVDGQANYSWDFTFKIEYYPVYPYMYGKMYSLYNETMISGDIENVAIFMDNNPWNMPSIQDVLDYYGISYDIYGSSDIGNVDLSQYDKVIIANDQTTSFYDAVEANLAWFEQYAFNGGQLEIHAADQGWYGGSWDVMPGGFTHTAYYYNYVDIAIPGHDVLVYPNVITDEELDLWGYSVHGYLTNLPANSEIVLTADGKPVFVVTSWGNGCIIISTQTLEWAYAGRSKFLENVILYCPLYGYPYDYLHKTWVTSEAVLDLNSWDEGCMNGVGLKSLMYRIYVNETGTWHPSSETDTYCGNYNITYVDGAYWYVAKNSTVNFTKVKFHEECEHILQMRAEDYVGNIRIVNQTHYVDNSPPKLKVEYPPEHGFYYDEKTGKMFVRACKEFYLNLTDEPNCGVGWRDFVFYFRYEYTNFTTPYIEKHPVSMDDTQYGEVVNISGELWWKITPQTPSIALHFSEECYHKIYYFYNASDWLDNSIVSDVLVEEIYVDEFEPEVSKQHPWCYKDEESIYLHPYSENVYEELYPEYGRKYYLEYKFEKDGNWYACMYDEKYGVYRLYLAEPIAYTLYLYNETNDKYLVYYGGNEPFEIGSLWHELYPEYCNIYELVDYNNGIILKNQTGEESEWKDYKAFSDYVTYTARLYNETNDKSIYIEYVGGKEGFVDSLWHELYPEFSNYYISTSYNETTHIITLNNTKTGKASEWVIVDGAKGDIKLKPVSYIRACDRINLTAKDMPDILKLVDQFQNEGNRADELQLRQHIPYWPWDAQTFEVSEAITAINEIWVWLDWTGPANVTLYLHEDGPFTPGNELGEVTVALTGTSTGEWVSFVFDNPINVTPSVNYTIEVFRENGSLVHWYHADKDVYLLGVPYISGEESNGDWKFAVVAYMPNPCASGIEGIYYAYEIGWDNTTAKVNHHPMNETDAPHGEKIVNITQYYDWDEINEFFNGYWLWYEYDENVGIHFYEECVHWLYYWAKDNVCHHTPVYMQVYEVDNGTPIVIKEHPEHGYYTPVEIDVDKTFANETYWLKGTFHVRDAWYPSYADGWKPNPSGQYTDKIQYINFTIYNNDMTHDLLLRLHVEEIVGDSGITLENGSDVNYKVYTINVPAGSSLIYTVNVYDNLEFLRWGVWSWWAEVENVTQYLRAGARINLSAYDVGEHPSGISNIYYRYEWNGNYYPQVGHPAAVNGSELQPDVPEIANYWWFIYNNSVGIVFNEECKHDLYYFAKDRSCHNSTLHHQTYYVDASEPVINETLPEHGAIGNTTTSLYEDFEAPFGNGWAVVNGTASTWSIKSEEPLFRQQVKVAYSGRYAAMAWRKDGSANAWLITPKITIPEDGNLTFWYKVYYGGSAGLKVGINSVSSQTDTSAFVEVWDSGIFSDTMYRHLEIDLSAYAGEEVYIGFYCYYLSDSFPNNGLLIDDVWVGAIHRIETLLEDDVEDGYGWQIEDLKIQQTSYWMLVNRLPVASP